MPTINNGNVLAIDIAEDAYYKFEALIHKFAWNYTRKYGGEFDDWLGECHLLFLDAVHTYNGTSQFITWLWNRLMWGLNDIVRKRTRQKTPTIVSLELLCEERELACPYRTSIEQRVNHVGDTAWELWQLVVNPPEELMGDIDPEDPDHTKDAIYRHCEYKLRWTAKQFTESITELKEICSE